MVNYSFKTAIPTASPSRGLNFDKDIYFSSNTYIYRYNQNVYSVVAQASGYIRDFYFVNEKFYILTNNELTISYNSKTIATMKKDGNYILATEDFIFTNDNNELEVWHNPKEYKMNMFELYRRNSEHTERITHILLYKDMVLTGSDDFTIRLFDIKKNLSRKIQTVKSRPIAIHQIENFILIFCDNGQIYKMKEENKNFVFVEKQQKEGKILCVCVSEDLYCVGVYKDNKTTIEIFKNFEIIFSLDIENKVEEMALKNGLLAVKCSDFVGLYDLKKDSFVLELVMPLIVTFDINKEYLIAGCSDKKLRLYDDNQIINTLQDPKSTHPIHKVFFVKNFILSLAIDGHISLFDVQNGTCFRSFKVPVKVSSAVVCDDGILLFLGDSDSCSIRIVDLQRSKEIDNLIGHEAIIKNLEYHKGSLFSLSLDNQVKKWNYLTGDQQTLDLDRMPITLKVEHNMISISFSNEIVTYDLDLNYLHSFDYSIKNRKRNEQYMTDKGAEHLEMSLDGKSVILGGEYNALFVCDISTGEILQKLRLSQNKNWENYDDRFYKNKKQNFDKEKIVETLRMRHSKDQYKIYVQTREGIVVFQSLNTQFSPLDLDVETTPEGIKNYIEKKEYLKGLLGSLRLGEEDIIQFVVLSTPEDSVEFVIKHIPEYLITILRETMLKMIQEDFEMTLVYLWLRWILFYHANSKTVNSGLETFKKKGEDLYKMGLENMFILKKLRKNK
jgi:periodic tryptophan protein 2